ncbi:hypothetical protein FEM03_09445 [Phragmitibacter flavus]|uniref:PRTase-CE domain-containing protein n=1 Tax=Phragmitibacter flavus TaxID=2576071 RepID=A0A5R8KFR1_9BACT|nr:hypothetical protein [Phragmitibacter flavus]TLD71127.1 hypothetical protein FEM03_09445 [Phragmitibacter flavus]
MKINALRDAVGEWDAGYIGDNIELTSKYLEILNRLEFLGKHEWCNYVPAESAAFEIGFLDRLASWIGNVDSSEDQKLLLEYAQRISFFSHQDFISLYRAAFCGPITRWVITQAGLRFSDPHFSRKLERELKRHTWYCPITDSMGINEFYHANHISGIEHRPSFSTLAMLNPINLAPDQTLLDNLKGFMKKPDRGPRRERPLKRLVLLEDFVGSGTQMKSAVKWAAQRLDIQILVVPLIICGPGMIVLNEMIDDYPSLLTASPVVEIGPDNLLGANGESENTWEQRNEMEDLANRLVSSHGIKEPFGYKETGCSVVTYSNVPNNSLSLIHQKVLKNRWIPLFPRSSRA